MKAEQARQLSLLKKDINKELAKIFNEVTIATTNGDFEVEIALNINTEFCYAIKERLLDLGYKVNFTEKLPYIVKIYWGGESR